MSRLLRRGLSVKLFWEAGSPGVGRAHIASYLVAQGRAGAEEEKTRT